MDQRAKFVLDVEAGEHSLVALCRSYGVSRKTAYKWLERYRREGVDGLRDRSRARHAQSNQVPDAVRSLIIQIRRRHSSWGPKKIRAVMQRDRPDLAAPSLTTIHEILKRAQLIRPRRRRAHPLHGALGTLGGEDRPNGVWSVDFKGEFKLLDGSYCFPLTVSDGHRRMLLACRAHHGVNGEPVRRVFTELFEIYGVPETIRSDNGVPFASTGIARLSALSVFWLDQGIALQRIAPGRPQQNGRHERIHRTLKAETARPPARTGRSNVGSMRFWNITTGTGRTKRWTFSVRRRCTNRRRRRSCATAFRMNIRLITKNDSCSPAAT